MQKPRLAVTFSLLYQEKRKLDNSLLESGDHTKERHFSWELEIKIKKKSEKYLLEQNIDTQTDLNSGYCQIASNLGPCLCRKGNTSGGECIYL